MKSNAYILLAVLVFLAVGSCSGEEGSSVPEVSEVPANPDALCTITPHAIKINVVDASTTPITRSATGEPEKEASYSENLGVNFSAEATLEAEPQDAQTRAGASLEAGAQYRIVVYDSSSGEIKGNVVYKQGSTAVVSGKEIKLKAGNYRLFAYSFNSTDAIRELEADNQNVTVLQSWDFMTYTVPNYTVSSTDYGSGKQLNISFTRQCARMTVKVIADGYTDNTITAANLRIANLMDNCQWNGYTNTDAASLPSGTTLGIFLKASADGPSVDCGRNSVTPYLNVLPCSNLTITSLGIYATIGGVSKNPDGFNFPNPVTLVKGGSYRLTIVMCNAYLLTRTNPVTIGGLKWARTNLQQDGSGTTAPVSFIANPWDYSTKWNYGMRDATREGASDCIKEYVPWNISTPGHANQDPCRSLGSGWRLPTSSEFNTLMNNKAPNGTKVKINGTINTIGNYGWAPESKGAIFMSGTQVVFLPASGYRIPSNPPELTARDIKGYYWSATPGPQYGSYFLWFGYDHLQVTYWDYKRSHGSPLRCVQD